MEGFTIFNVVRIFTVATLAVFLALALEPLWMRFLRRYFARGKEIAKKSDTFWGPTPIFNALHKKKEGTPTMGGFIIWASVALLTLVFWALHGTVDGFWSRMNFLSRAETYLPLAFLVVAGIAGMADDIAGIKRRSGFGMKERLFLFTVLAGVGGWWFVAKLGRDALNVPFLGDVVIGPVWYFLFFVAVMVATSFSADITDGLDGLSGGVFLTVFGALGAIAFDQGRMDLAVFIAAIIGGLLAFLWFNIYPAKFFMGDTGVMALGFVAGSTALLLNVPLLLPLIAVVPLVEASSVIIQTLSKKFRGKKVFLSTPIHHTFEAMGWHETQITMRFWMLNAVGAIIALTLFLVDSVIPPLNAEVIRELMRTVL
ncbi:MAG TPA: phospho-N-acetylmuramoyl-pentapeptide-transferase [Candidatus Paceibacterota bacterium]|nr:phospho-N-acetylmuramoyl-pentapeptide-transferase [Candidatus Paceibacterota bacterium]